MNMPIREETRTLTGKMKYVMARLPESKRSDPEAVTRAVTATFYMGLPPSFVPPNVAKVTAALKKILRGSPEIPNYARPYADPL